jgi:hypothetical protein
MAITAGEEGHSEATNTTAANQLGVGGKGRVRVRVIRWHFVRDCSST